jgi:4-aminobutyrate--pyruvate transaminase
LGKSFGERWAVSVTALNVADLRVLLDNSYTFGEARGLGLIGGVELVANKKTRQSFGPAQGVGPRAVRFAEDEGLIVRAVMGDVLTLCPPLIITDGETDELFDRLTRALDKTLDWVRRERLDQV